MSAQPIVPQVDDVSPELESGALARQEHRERRRQRRLKSANGVASWTWYPFFRGIVLMLSGSFAVFENLHAERMPGGIDYYPPKYSRHHGSLGEYPCVVAARHTSVLDIPGLGQLARGMAWLCKPAFCGRWWYAKICQRMGAVPLMRAGKDDSPKLKPAKIRQNQRSSFLERGEYAPRISSVLRRGGTANGFPQGGRDHEGQKLTSAKSGLVGFAIEAQVPLVPMSIVGAAKSDPRVYINRLTGREHARDRPSSKLVRALFCVPYRLKILVLYGEPIMPPEIPLDCEVELERTVRRDLLDDLLDAINTLTQEGCDILRAHAA